MTRFCGQCGAPAGEQRFCGSCGAPLQPASTGPASAPSAADETATRPVMDVDSRTVARPQRATQPPAAAPSWPAAPSWQAPAGAPQQPAAQPQQVSQPSAPPPYGAPQPQQWGGQMQAPMQAPRPPRAVPLGNPFIGMPVSDYVKDAGAALALLVALGQPWDAAGDAVNHWWALLSILLAVLGLGVPYLMASRVIPTFTPQASLVTKLALAAPLLVSTLVALVMDLMTIGDDSFAGLGGIPNEGGMGLAIALALGGAALMAQPRRHEEATGLLAERAWRTAATAAAVAALVVAIATFIAGSVSIANNSFVSGAQFWVIWVVANLVLPTIFVGLPLVAMLRGSAGGRRTFAVLAWGVVLVGLFAEPAGGGAVTGAQVEGWAGPASGVWLLGLAGGLLLSRPCVRGTQGGEVDGWLGTARVALATAAAANLGAAVSFLLVMTMIETFPGILIAVTLMYVGVAVATGVAASMATHLAMRLTVSGAAAVAVVIGVVMWVVVVTNDDLVVSQAQFTVRDVVILFALPGLALYALWVPPQVRAAVPRSAPAAAWGQYQGDAAAQQFARQPDQSWTQQPGQPGAQPPVGPSPGWGPPSQPPAQDS